MSSMVLGLLDQLQIFLQIYLIELLTFNRFGATWYIQGRVDRVLNTGLLHKLKSYEISGQIFGFICSFLSNRPL